MAKTNLPKARSRFPRTDEFNAQAKVAEEVKWAEFGLREDFIVPSSRRPYDSSSGSKGD